MAITFDPEGNIRIAAEAVGSAITDVSKAIPNIFGSPPSDQATPPPSTPPDLSTLASEGKIFTVPMPKSQIRSSAAPVISQSQNQASGNAAQTLNNNEQNPPSTNPTPTPNQGYTYNGVYYNNGTAPEGYMMFSTPPTAQQAPNGYILAPNKDNQGNPVYLANKSPNAGQPGYDQYGNPNPITLDAKGQPVAAVASAPDKGAQAQSLVTKNIGEGYTTSLDATGNYAITDPNGQVVGSIPPQVIGDTTMEAPYISAAQTKVSSLAAAASQLQTDLAAAKTQHDQNLEALRREQSSAEGEMRAVIGESVGSTDVSSNASVTGYYQDLINQENDRYQQMIAQAHTNNLQAVAAANQEFEKETSQILQTGQAAAQAEQKLAQTNASNILGSVTPMAAGLPPTTDISKLPINAQGLTDNHYIDSALGVLMKSGQYTTPQAALGALQANWTLNQKQLIAQAQALQANIPYYAIQGLTDDQILSNYGAVVSAWEATGMSQSEAVSQVKQLSLQQQKQTFTETGLAPGMPAVTGQSNGQAAPQNSGLLIGMVDTSQKVDPNFVIPGIGGKYTQADIDKMAEQVNAGQNIRTVIGAGFSGSSAQTANLLAAVRNRSTQMNPSGVSVVANAQYLKGLQVSTDTASRLQTVVKASISNAQYSIDLLLGTNVSGQNTTTVGKGLVSQINFGTDVIWNDATATYVSRIGVGASAQKEAAMTDYLQAINAITNEYGRILYGGTSGEATDASRKASGESLNPRFASGSMTSVLQQIQGEMNARLNGYQDVVTGNQQSIINSMQQGSDGNIYFDSVSAIPSSSAGGTAGARTTGGGSTGGGGTAGNSVTTWGWNP